MIREIRVSALDIEAISSNDWSIMKMLYDKGFPCDDTFKFALRPRKDLEYSQHQDHKTGEIVVRWEE